MIPKSGSQVTWVEILHIFLRNCWEWTGDIPICVFEFNEQENIAHEVFTTRPSNAEQFKLGVRKLKRKHGQHKMCKIFGPSISLRKDFESVPRLSILWDTGCKEHRCWIKQFMSSDPTDPNLTNLVSLNPLFWIQDWIVDSDSVPCKMTERSSWSKAFSTVPGL